MIIINPLLCDLCGACPAVCPVDCISLDESRLTIDQEICTDCQLCIKVCPFGALSLEKGGE
jgi:ferredoxin